MRAVPEMWQLPAACTSAPKVRQGFSLHVSGSKGTGNVMFDLKSVTQHESAQRYLGCPEVHPPRSGGWSRSRAISSLAALHKGRHQLPWGFA